MLLASGAASFQFQKPPVPQKATWRRPDVHDVRWHGAKRATSLRATAGALLLSAGMAAHPCFVVGSRQTRRWKAVRSLTSGSIPMERKRSIRGLVQRRAACKTVEGTQDDDFNAILETAVRSRNAAGSGGSCALLLVPRKLASQLPSMVQSAAAALQATWPVVGVLTGGSKISLACMDALPGSVVSCCLSSDAALGEFMASLQSVASTCKTMLVFIDPSASPYIQQQIMIAVGNVAAGAAKVGIVVAPPPAQSDATVAVNGQGRAIAAVLALPVTATVGLELAGCSNAGEPLEVFEADLRKGAPSTILQIGTMEEGDVKDASETEKGTAGIIRRKGIPPAKALQDVMKAHSVQAPKDLYLGLAREGRLTASPSMSPSAEDWSIFYWVGVTQNGGVRLGGGDVVSEGLCPRGSVEWLQPLQVAPSSTAWRGLVDECCQRAASSGRASTFAALALAGGRGLSPQEGQAAAATRCPAMPLGALGLALLSTSTRTGELMLHRQAVALILLHDDAPSAS